jgi:hypothetical protein
MNLLLICCILIKFLLTRKSSASNFTN